MLNNGWKLKCGKYIDSYVNETQIWNLFDNFFSTGSTKNTAYKFIFMKSIVEIVSEHEVNEKINYYNIFEKFTPLGESLSEPILGVFPPFPAGTSVI